ncbi:hypothetical protein Tco_0022681, partial [Tanacetum coccineum]
VHQENILLPLQPHRTRIPVKDVVQDAQEQPSKNSSPDKDIQDSDDVIDKEGQHQIQAFEEEKRRIPSQKKATQATSTNQLSIDRPFVSTDRSFISKIPIDASTLPNADLPIDPNMPDLKDASDTLPNDGIFNGAYDDDEDVGAVISTTWIKPLLSVLFPHSEFIRIIQKDKF